MVVGARSERPILRRLGWLTSRSPGKSVVTMGDLLGILLQGRLDPDQCGCHRRPCDQTEGLHALTGLGCGVVLEQSCSPPLGYYRSTSPRTPSPPIDPIRGEPHAYNIPALRHRYTSGAAAQRVWSRVETT